jgi:hypothetical protein
MSDSRERVCIKHQVDALSKVHTGDFQDSNVGKLLGKMNIVDSHPLAEWMKILKGFEN